MSKQTDAKTRQGYSPKAVPHTCGNCRHCLPVMGEVLAYINPQSFMDGTHMVPTQVSQKCGLGGFAVKKMGTCEVFEIFTQPSL